MAGVQQSTRMQPLLAWRAVKELISNPEDTAQVFTIIRALSGPSLQKGLQRFIELPFGRRVIEEKFDLLATLSDRETLRSHPKGSLAEAYLQFVESENLSADGLVEASESETGSYDNAWLQRYGLRLRDQHDLWHTTTGYGRDELGELCLLAFTYAQTRNRGIGFIVLVGMMKMRKSFGNAVFKAVRDGFRDGRRASWLPGQNWEALLQRPLADVRAELNIGEPQTYQLIRQQAVTA